MAITDVRMKIDAVIGYLEYKTGKFQPQKLLVQNVKNKLIWRDPNKTFLRDFDQNHIYAIAQIDNNYTLPASLADSESQSKMFVSVNFVINPDFKKDGFISGFSSEETQGDSDDDETQEETQLDETQLDETQAHDSQIDKTTGRYTGATDDEFPEMLDLQKDRENNGGIDNGGMDDNGGILVDDGGMECRTETGSLINVMDGLQMWHHNNYDYLNLTEWPRNGFQFTVKGNGLVYNFPTDGKKMFKVNDRDQITIKMGEARKGVLDPIVDGKRSREKWCFEDEYDYYLAPLEDHMQKKVYTPLFMNENFELLKSLMYPRNPRPDEDVFDSTVMQRLKKHYGFLEIFKKSREVGSKYEATGKLHHLSY